MDWNLAIEKNREALRRILAMLVAMVDSGERRERRRDSSLSFRGRERRFRTGSG